LIGLTVLLWGRSASAEPNLGGRAALGVRVVCDGERYGAAVVVHDFRSGVDSGSLVLTALHVVQGCRRLEAVLVGCPAPQHPELIGPYSAERPIRLLVWPEYDLAAIEVPEHERASLSKRVPSVRIAANSSRARPPYLSDLTLLAKSGVNVCPRIPARRRDIVTVDEVYKSLDEPDYVALFGSLSSRTVLMSYESTALGGTSGAPVVWTNGAREAAQRAHRRRIAT
jgi:hypothetical protein